MELTYRDRMYLKSSNRLLFSRSYLLMNNHLLTMFSSLRYHYDLFLFVIHFNNKKLYNDPKIELTQVRTGDPQIDFDVNVFMKELR